MQYLYQGEKITFTFYCEWNDSKPFISWGELGKLHQASEQRTENVLIECGVSGFLDIISLPALLVQMSHKYYQDKCRFLNINLESESTNNHELRINL